MVPIFYNRLIPILCQACRSTPIGSRLARGVSGGERKRTSLACGLLSRPRAVFMDEPTSGLDSATAADVMASVSALRTDTACTLLVTIHAPAPAVVDLFVGLLLLQSGRVAYFGPGGSAPLAFFASQARSPGRFCSRPPPLPRAQAAHG